MSVPHLAGAGLPDPPPIGSGRIVCAINDSLCAREAAFQAATLARPGDALTFVSVTDGGGPGAARRAVDAGRAIARGEGRDAATAIVDGHDVNEAILSAARDADLLVVGAHGRSRLAGIVLGRTTSRAVHSSPVPVLVARSCPELTFPGTVLVGTQGEQDDHAAVVAARIAAAHGGRVVLAHVGRSSAAVRHALAMQGAEVLAITGAEPVVIGVDGAPSERLPAMARSIDAGLVILGSRGMTGPRALASVSERVAHRAPCSVLVLRGAASAAL